MAHLRQENYQIWFDERLLEKVNSEIFDIEYWQAKGKVLGQAKGRGITWFVQTSTLPAALRHYHRGGLFGKLVRDNYLFTGFENTRVAKEFALLQYLYSNDLSVPRPIAARAIKSGITYSADILIEKINDAADLVSVLKKAPLSGEAYRQIGELIAKLHRLQVCHTDLNIHNILLDSRGKFWLIDFDKCGKREGDNWKNINLDRLYRSFNKELIREKIFWQAKNWQVLLLGYKAIGK